MRRWWRRRRCRDGHRWLWHIDDRTGVAVEKCWFCSATRARERMAPRHMKPER